MLEEKDLQAIQSLLQDNNESIKKELRSLHDSNDSIKKEMQALHDSNDSIKKEMQALHDSNDSIKKEMQALHDSNDSIKKEMQALHDSNANIKKDIQAMQHLLQDNNKILKKELRKSIVESEKMLLGEMDRMKGFLNARIDKLEDAVQELTQQYRLNKAESDNLSLLLQSMVHMQQEIENIKQQIA